jgi:nicotinate-nucleotide adenylyltransferase
MTPEPGRTGILGGTFDPVHEGHVAAAEAACAALALDRVLLLPSHLPPHRPSQPRASAFHRFAMLSLAIGGHPQLAASDVELLLAGPSFTAVTLRRLLEIGYQASQLFFIIGTDAFAEIASWHDFPAVLDLAHFVVISRPGQSFDVLHRRLPALVPRMRVGGGPAGIGETGHGCLVFLVNAATPDVSSTAIRERAARGDSLGGLVVPEVERHIRKHGLYGSRQTPSGSGLA